MSLSLHFDWVPLAPAGLPLLYIAFFYALDEICHSGWAYRRAAQPAHPRRRLLPAGSRGSRALRLAGTGVAVVAVAAAFSLGLAAVTPGGDGPGPGTAVRTSVPAAVSDLDADEWRNLGRKAGVLTTAVLPAASRSAALTPGR